MADDPTQKKQGRAMDWLRDALARQPTPSASQESLAPESGWDEVIEAQVVASRPAPVEPEAGAGKIPAGESGGKGRKKGGARGGRRSKAAGATPAPEQAQEGREATTPEEVVEVGPELLPEDLAGEDLEDAATEIGAPPPPDTEESFAEIERVPTNRRRSPDATGAPAGGWQNAGEQLWDDGDPDPFDSYFPDLKPTVPVPLFRSRPPAEGVGPQERTATPFPQRSQTRQPQRTSTPMPLRSATPQLQRRATPVPQRAATPVPLQRSQAPCPQPAMMPMPQRGQTPQPGASGGPGGWADRDDGLEDAATGPRALYRTPQPEPVQAVPVEADRRLPQDGRPAGVAQILGDPGFDTGFEDDDEGYEASYEPVPRSQALQPAGYASQPQYPAVAEPDRGGMAEWEDQPTSLFQGRTITQPPPQMEVLRRSNTTSRAVVVHPGANAIDGFQDLVGGPLVASRQVGPAELVEVVHLVPALFEPDSFVANQYRLLGQKLEEASSIDFCRIAAVTSAGDGDGKSTTALNLALILAEEPNRRVGLIDCNLRSPSLARILSLPDEGGLVGVYRRQLTLAEALVRVGDRELYLLPAGEPFANPTEILRSPLLTAIIRKMETEFSLVVIDTPSILPSADITLLARLVDRYIIVVRAGRTRRHTLAEALRRLDESKVLGLVFNGQDEEE